MQTPIWAWATPIIVAILALCGVVFTIIIQWRNFNRQLRAAHTLKIAEMRQAWINNLRDSMSTFQSYGVTPNLNHNQHREWYEAGTKIELLMNPSDNDFDKLQEKMYEFFQVNNVSDKYAANAEFIMVCQNILQREWETLKAEVYAAGSS